MADPSAAFLQRPRPPAAPAASPHPSPSSGAAAAPGAAGRPRAPAPDGWRAAWPEAAVGTDAAGPPPRGRVGGAFAADLRREDAPTPVPQYLSNTDADAVLGIRHSADRVPNSPSRDRWPLRSKREEPARFPAAPDRAPPAESEPLSVIVIRDCILTPFLQGFLLGMLGHLHTFLVLRKPLRLLFGGIADLVKRPFKKRERDFAD